MQSLNYIFSPLKRRLFVLKSRINPRHILDEILKVSSPSASLDSIRNPPTSEPLILSNAYVPLSRRTLVRELLQDSSIVLPSERSDFEKVAHYLDRKLESQFHLIQNELATLLQPVEQSGSMQCDSSAASENNMNRLDKEFWLIRRITDLAPVAGFTEVSIDKLDAISNARKVGKENLIAFADPNDYDVLRFWIRGFHPHYNENEISKPTYESSGEKERGTNFVFTKLKHLGKNQSSFAKRPNKFCFTKVFMITRLKNSRTPELKLFKTVPTSGFLHQSNFADNLLYLLPLLHTSPLSPFTRNLLWLSVGTAAASIGLLSPLAWLLQFDTDLVLAWSVAASTTAGASISLMWTRYWRATTKFAYSLRQLHYESCQCSGFQSVNSLLRLAYEEEFKAVLLTYALLLRPSEASSPISPTQLSVRAESWLAGRISPKSHVSLPSTNEAIAANVTLPTSTQFSGGSGPLFDIRFNAERYVRLLRRLDLVHGTKSNPTVVRPNIVASELHSTSLNDHQSLGLNRLWINDLLGHESDLGAIEN